jgi:zinc transport system substrate-binding protein
LLLGSILTAAISVLTSCSLVEPPGTQAAPSTGVRVVVSFYPLQFVTERVGADDVTVVNLTPPGASSHDLELRPSQIIDITEADLVVYQSGFQPATDEAIAQNRPEHVVDAAQRAEIADRDPHFWLDPTRLSAVVTHVAEALSDIDPDNAADYTARANTLRDDLTELDRSYQRALAACSGAALVTSHTAFGYLADRYHLRQIGIRGIDPETEPSPARIREVSEIITDNNVSTIYFEVLTSPKVTATLAADLNVTTAVLDPIENQTTPDNDYLDVMKANQKVLQTGLTCRS